ncbi:MAG: EamA family transporter [Gammaproteobacteria bacterium]|nr:EamA family transporter [Gammaproteobacteria bacterium]
MDQHAPRSAILLAFLCVLVVWGTTYLAVAIVLRDLPPFLSAAMRYTLAAVVLYAGLRLRQPRPMAGLPVRTVVISGVLLCGCGNGFTVFAMQQVPSGIAALLNSTIPICVTLVDWGFFARRRPSIWTGIGLAAGVGGVTLLVRQTTATTGLAGIGYVACLALAVLTWSVGTLVQRDAVPRERLLALLCGQMAAGAAFLCAAGLLNDEFSSLDLARVSAPAWLGVLYLALFGSLLTQWCYLWLLSRWPAEKVTTYAVVNPVIAMFLGAAVLDEAVTTSSLLGALLVLAGVALVLFEHKAAAWAQRILSPG